MFKYVPDFFRAETAGDTRSKAPHVVLDQLQRVGGKGTRSAADKGLFRDHVVGVAGMDLGDAQDRRVERLIGAQTSDVWRGVMDVATNALRLEIGPA